MDLVLIGMPGSGKSIVGKALAEHYGMIYISSGDIARKIAEHDKIAEKHLNDGKLGPEFLVRNELWHQANKAYASGKSIVFDGFPRFIDQDEFLKKNISPFPLYIYIDVPHDVAIERLINRDRDDDNAHVIAHRMKFFKTRTLPVLNLHNDTDTIEIDGNGNMDSIIKITIERIDEFVNNCKA